MKNVDETQKAADKWVLTQKQLIDVTDLIGQPTYVVCVSVELRSLGYWGLTNFNLYTNLHDLSATKRASMSIYCISKFE